MATATTTAVPFASTEVYDTDSFHSTSTNTSRITIPSGKGGYYLIYYSGTWEDATVGDRIVYLYKNGAAINQVYQYTRDVQPAGAGYYSQQFSTVVSAVATDYFEVFVRQGSGGNKNLYGDSGAGNLPGLRFGCALLGV